MFFFIFFFVSKFKMPFYAVKIGLKTGVFESWIECEKYVKGYPNACYKSFTLKQDAEIFCGKGIGTLLPCKKRKMLPEHLEEALDELIEIKKAKREEEHNNSIPQSHVLRENRISDPKTLNVYCDGAASKNGTIVSKAGYGIFFGFGDPRNVSKRVPSDKIQTNNSAELWAIDQAIEIVKGISVRDQYEDIVIHTDSEYSLNSCTKWVNGWMKNGWRTKEGNAVKNRTLIHRINKNLTDFSKISLCHVRAHTNKNDAHSIGNREADRLAKESLLKE